MMILIVGFLIWWGIGVVVFVSNINERDPAEDFDIGDLFFDFWFSFFGPLLAFTFVSVLIRDIVIIKGKERIENEDR